MEFSDLQIRRLLGQIGGEKSVRVSDFLGNITLTQLGTYEQYLRACTSKVWASWKACDLVSQSVSTTPFKVTRGEGDADVKIPDLAQLLTYPNDNQTFGELVYLSTMHLKMTGSAFWYKAEARAVDGQRPRSLIPLNPSRVRITVDDSTGEVIGYQVNLGKKVVPLDAGEVIHFRRPHPNHDYNGLGDVEAGETPISEALNSAQQRTNQWRNSGAPSGILVKKEGQLDAQMAPDDWRKLKADYLAAYGGTENAGKQAFLTGDWSYLKVGLNASEMQDIERSKLTTEEIFLLHGVPLSVAGVRDAANYATSQIDLTRYQSLTVAPMVRLIMDTMNTDLIIDWGKDLRIKFELSGLINIGAVLQDVLPAFDRGIVSINEVRRMIGLKTDEANPLWTEHYINAGLTPLTLAGLANADQAAAQGKRIVDRFVEATFAGGKPS